MELEILFRDEHLIAINKPPGLLVHRTRIAEERKYFAVQLLRDQVGQRVYPVHRLDRKTSGVLLFALNKDIGSALGNLFRDQQMQKVYYAIVRGYLEEKALIDYALKKEKVGVLQEAQTSYECLNTIEIDQAVGPYERSRYSLAKVHPHTGRMHQIRRHFAHIRHPIVGDRPHGDWRHNKMFKEVLGIPHMLLHAQQLAFIHPVTAAPILLTAPFFSSFAATLALFNWKLELR